MNHGKKIRVVTQRGTFYLYVDGKPDGSEPMLPKFLEHKTEHTRNTYENFVLSDFDVQSLGEEAFLYRLRREYFLKVGDYPRAIRDVNIGIQIVELIMTHAENPGYSASFCQYRPDQEIFKRTAESKLAIQQKDYWLARQRLELASHFVQEFAHIHSDIFPEEWLENRLDQLRKAYDEIGNMWENDISPLRNTPPSLEQQLKSAIEIEDYERAAVLRDMILKHKKSK